MKIIAYVVGYGVSIGLGFLVTWFVAGRLYKKYNFKKAYVALPSALLGICERVLYTSAWIIGFKEFIIFWLLAKVGAGWIYQRGPITVELRREAQQEQIRQTRRTENLEKQKEDAIRFNISMIGNAVSIIFGVLGALIIKHWGN